jgi:hypothetical protein
MSNGLTTAVITANLEDGIDGFATGGVADHTTMIATVRAGFVNRKETKGGDRDKDGTEFIHSGEMG